MTPQSITLRKKLARIDACARRCTELVFSGALASTPTGNATIIAETLWARLKDLETAMVNAQLDLLVFIALSEDEDRAFYEALQTRMAESAPLPESLGQGDERRAA